MVAYTSAKTPVYSMSVVEGMTGLTARQIRYYEKRGLLNPARTRGNKRLYSQLDVERLQAIKDLMKKGYDLKGIKELLDREDTGHHGGPEMRIRESVHTCGQAQIDQGEASVYFRRRKSKPRVRGEQQLGRVPAPPARESYGTLRKEREIRSLYPLRDRPRLLELMDRKRS